MIEYFNIACLFLETGLFSIFVGRSLSDAWMQSGTQHADPGLALSRHSLYLTWALLVALEPLAFFGWASSVIDVGPWKTAASLPQLLTSTHYGHIFAIRYAALLLIPPLALRLPRRESFFCILLFACVFAWSRGVTGHGGDLGSYAWPVWSDSVHFLAISLWTGGVCAVAWRSAAAVKEQPHEFGTAIQKLSRIAAWFLILAVITGVLNGMHVLTHPADLVVNPYGQLLDLKLFIVSIVLLSAAISRFVLLPHLAHVPEAVGFQPSAGIIGINRLPATRVAAILQMNLRVESLLLLLAVMLASLLRQTIPPMVM